MTPEEFEKKYDEYLKQGLKKVSDFNATHKSEDKFTQLFQSERLLQKQLLKSFMTDKDH